MNMDPRQSITGLLIAMLLAGCSRSPADPAAAQPPGPAPNRSKYVLADEPAGAQGVRQVRQAAKDQDEVIVVGRIGGLANPWVEGRAAFSIVDPALKSCHDMGDDDCPTPWDYC